MLKTAKPSQASNKRVFRKRVLGVVDTPGAKKFGIITIRLKRGLIACNPVQRATVRGLGLKSREQMRSLENTPAVRGMIKKVLHLLEIVSESAPV